ncbi:MAG: DUF1751 domain-containing protein [Myxococcota bacterium]
MRPQVQVVLPPFRNASTVLAVLVIVSSIFWKVALDAGVGLYLVPASVLEGRVWQLVTWLPAELPSTNAVIFSALILWSTGGPLELLWGRARFLRFVLVTTALAGVLTLLTGALLSSVGEKPFGGGGVMSGIVWVGYGCALWHAETNIFGVPVKGRTFALLGVFFAALNAVLSGPQLLVAEGWGLLLTFAYARFGFPRETLVRFRSWQLQRDLKKRSKHLKSIDGGRNTGRGSDKYLH